MVSRKNKRNSRSASRDADWVDGILDAAWVPFSWFKQAWIDSVAALKHDKWSRWVLLVFAFALFSRLCRPDWYVTQQFHPDERWLFGTVTPLHWPELPGKATGDGAGLQYGSLPLYAAAAVKGVMMTFYSAVHAPYDVNIGIRTIGRSFTGLMDVASVFFIFMLGAQLFSRRVGALAAAFLAFTPLNIQLSHFFTVDPWGACFAIATLYGCAKIFETRSLNWSVLTGIAYAAALASKSSTLPLALPIFLAHAWPCFDPLLKKQSEKRARILDMAIALGLAVVTTLVAFLIFMPMWQGSEWEKFFSNQREQQNILVTGSPEGTPFVRQYWDTNLLFHLRNLLLYYQGAALGVISMLAVLWYLILPVKALLAPKAVAPRSKVKSDTGIYSALTEFFGPILVLSWVLPYFVIVGIFSFAKFARYMLPITPFLALLSAAMIESLWKKMGDRRAWVWWLALAAMLVSAGYGCAYLGTYFQPHPWMETSRWMLGGGVPLNTVEDGVSRRTRVYNETWGDDLPVDVPGAGNAGSYDNRKIDIVQWDGTRKLEEFGTVLSQADAIVMADPRAYGTYLRIPSRFPLTYAYFEIMMTDPAKLGFELAHQSSNPMRLFGLITIDDDRTLEVPRWAWADESFTLYDRPHAFVFKKIRPVTAEEVEGVLQARVKELGLPDSWRQGLSPEENRRIAEGSEPAPAASTVEDTSQTNPNIGMSRGAMVPILQPVITWWLLVSLLGILVMPLSLLVFKDFPDGGYALSRAMGLFLFSWLAYNLAWLKILYFYQSSLGILLGISVLLTGIWAWPRRGVLKAWILLHKTEMLWSEAIFASAFLFFVLVRAYNPNIHDIAGQGYFGGGEPLGMTYLSAVTRCATFPVFDPWLAPKDSSYYYFGYVIAATLTKLSGFRPAITYNLSLPLFFALSMVSAYGVGRALVKRRIFALASALSVAAFGALSSVFVFMEKLNQPGQNLLTAWFSHEMIWDPTRFPQLVQGHIFEFPFFSYLYGDLHPHNMVVPFALVLTGLLLVPFKSKIAGWRAFGETGPRMVLWVGLTALILDAQYAINTWNWPVFLGLSLGAALLGPWAGKRLEPIQGLIASGWGFLIWIVMVGIPTKLLGLGGLLMFGFRHYFIQDANRLGVVQPSEWQMVGYIPLAFFAFGFCGLAALGSMRLKAWWWSQDKTLGLKQALRRDIFEAVPTILDRAFSRMPVRAFALSLALVLTAGFLAASLPGVYQGSVLMLSLGLSIVFLCLFCMGGWQDGDEAFLWMLGAFTALLVAGSERWFVADRMNTIFKFWFNGWVLMALAFGVGFAKWFEFAEATPKKTRRSRKSTTPLWLPIVIASAAVFFMVCFAAYLDVSVQGLGWRNAPSYFALAGLLVVPGLWSGFSPYQPRLGGKAVFCALMALGLLYPVGATIARIGETSGFSNPHLDGMAFMRDRMERGSSPDVKDYDKYDAAIMDWLNTHADKTEVLLEAPGVEMYKGYSRYAIYTGLPTILGWDYQVGQQLGSRAGDQIRVRTQDALRIYSSNDIEEVKGLLRKYQVHWIVVGTIERKLFVNQTEGVDFDKFGGFCKEVLRNPGAVLYRYDEASPEISGQAVSGTAAVAAP